MVRSTWSSFLMKHAAVKNIWFKTTSLLHISYRQNARDANFMHHQICSNTQVFVSMFDTRMVLSFVIEKMAIVGMGNKKIATTLGLPESTTWRWWCRSKTLRKYTSFNTSSATPLRYAQTQTTPHTDNTPSRRGQRPTVAHPKMKLGHCFLFWASRKRWKHTI